MLMYGWWAECGRGAGESARGMGDLGGGHVGHLEDGVHLHVNAAVEGVFFCI